MKVLDMDRAASMWPQGPGGPADSVREFEADRLGFLSNAARQFGDFVPFRLRGKQAVLISHPEFLDEVLAGARARDFSKDYLTDLIPALVRRHLLLRDPDSWLTERRLSQPAFHHDRLVGYARVIVEEAERMVAAWLSVDRLQVTTATRRLTLQILCRTLFDVDISEQSGHAAELIDLLLKQIDARVARRGAALLAVPSDLRLLIRLLRLERELNGVIRERRLRPDGRPDLLSQLSQMLGPAGAPLSNGRIRNVVAPLFFAGHETTAMSLAWTLDLLARYPDCQRRAREEVDRVLGSRSVTQADIGALTYLGWVINEALRLYPPIWGFGRQAIRSTSVGPYRLPTGTILWMSQWVIQRDPRWFERPDQFLPERWADGLAKRLPRGAYFPFGAGPRRCLGGTFATWEITLVLATVLRRVRLDLDGRADIVPEPSFTLRPRGALLTLANRH
jgi:cytochrome P450